MYEFWYDSVKQKCSKKAKLCHINTDNLIVYIKADDIYKEIWLMIDEFGGKIMTRFVGLWAKIYS